MVTYYQYVSQSVEVTKHLAYTKVQHMAVLVCMLTGILSLKCSHAAWPPWQCPDYFPKGEAVNWPLLIAAGPAGLKPAL